MFCKINKLSVVAASVVAGLTMGIRSSHADSLAAPVGLGWSYGEYSTGTTFSPFTTPPVLLTGSLTGLEEWIGGAPRQSPTQTDPNVIYNTTSKDIYTDPNSGNIDFAANSLDLGPWYGPTVVRYTAAVAGAYGITADFQTAQLDNTSPTAYVYIGGAQNWSSGQLAAPAGTPGGTTDRLGAASEFSSPVTLSAGETVDFVVWGSDSDNKTTQLSVLISAPQATVAVPLPASAGVGFSMLGVVGLAASLRKKFGAKSRIA